MGDEKTPEALRELEERRPGPGSDDGPPQSALGIALRVSVELVAAIGVGVAIGWLIDAWLDTSPWGLIVLVFLGGVAGMLNVYKLAKGFALGPGFRKDR
jgi:ATP synthase protein I